MKKLIAVSLIVTAALGLSACGTQGGGNSVIVNEEVVSNGDFVPDANGADALSNDNAANETAVPDNAAANVATN